MSGGKFEMGDYVDVAERIRQFRERYPDGSLQPADLSVPYRVETIGTEVVITVVAAAYRSEDDKRPGVGSASEPYPGRTPYTRGSELQNAETSAWGRAIVAALAADTRRGVASAEEVRNRRAERAPVDPAERMSKAREAIAAAGNVEKLDRIGRYIGGLVDGGELGEDEAAELHELLHARLGDRLRVELHAALPEHESKDRNAKLALCAAVIGRDVGSTSDMTHDEHRQVIASLREAQRQPPAGADEGPQA